MHRYVYVALGGLAVGIAWRSLYDFGLSFTVFLGFLVFMLCIAWYARVLRAWWVPSVLIAALFFTLGIVRMHTIVPDIQTPTPLGEEVVFEGRIVREPDARGTYTNLIVAADALPHHILVRTSSYTTFSYADTVRVSGVLETPQNFEGEGGRVFNYRGYLAKDDVHFIVAFPEIEVLTQRTTPTGLLLSLKQKYLSALTRALPEPSAALAGGITVGERRSLGEKLTQAFRDTGLIHIVVLSGYNIGIIVIAIGGILAFLPNRARYTAVIIAIVLFTIFVGASATVVRAALMGSIGALGAMAQRTYDALHGLIVAGAVMLLWNPYLLIYDPSFQLSFVATLGLLLGVPLLTPHLTFIPERCALRELAAATIATQVAVLPLLAYMIGDVSVVALVVNMLVLPVIPFAMFMVFLTGVVGSVATFVAVPFAMLAHGALVYVIGVVEFFAQLPLVTVGIPEFSILFVFIVYAAMAAVVIPLWRSNTKVKVRI